MSRKTVRLLVTVVAFLSVLMPLSSVSAETIPLVKNGNLYEVPVQINGVITLNFVLDTGASNVIISQDVVQTLIRAGTIHKSDFRANHTYVLADGSEHTGATVILRSLKIGTHIITDVVAGVLPASSDLLLGQGVLKKLGVWGIDNQKQILTIGTPLAPATVPTKQVSLPQNVTPINIDKGFIAGNVLSYAGYIVERSFVLDEKQYSTTHVSGTSSGSITKDGKVLVSFGKGSSWKDSTRIGLFSLLGNGLKQLIVEQYSGGASCCYSYKIYELLPHLRLIFDDQTYNTGYYPLDVEGKEKLILIRMIRPLTDFCNACTPVTIAVFLYDGNLGQYILANKNFANYILQRQHSQRIKNELDENGKREILSAFLDYVYVGQESEAWEFYNNKYTDTDKEELRQNILREFQSDTIHYAIYGR